MYPCATTSAGVLAYRGFVWCAGRYGNKKQVKMLKLCRALSLNLSFEYRTSVPEILKSVSVTAHVLYEPGLSMGNERLVLREAITTGKLS